jgi:hypothetical protein
VFTDNHEVSAGLARSCGNHIFRPAIAYIQAEPVQFQSCAKVLEPCCGTGTGALQHFGTRRRCGFTAHEPRCLGYIECMDEHTIRLRRKMPARPANRLD